MEKKLPKVFANKIEKELCNNEKVYYERTFKDEPKEEIKENNKGILLSEEFSINQKINKIFGSSRYVYKADVKIKLKDGNIINKKVIGRNKYELITMDSELIKVTDIIDIEFSDS